MKQANDLYITFQICRPPFWGAFLHIFFFLPGGGLLVAHVLPPDWLVDNQVVDWRYNGNLTPVKEYSGGACLL